MAYEKQKEVAQKQKGDYVTVRIERAEKELDQRRMISLYKTQGYELAGTEEDGTVLMKNSRERAEKNVREAQEVARQRLTKVQASDRAEFGLGLRQSGVTLTREPLRRVVGE